MGGGLEGVHLFLVIRDYEKHAFAHDGILW